MRSETAAGPQAGAAMAPWAKAFVALGSLAMLLAVAMGAFGAHALKNTLAPDLMVTYQTAVNYHVYHALGLLAVGLLAPRLPGTVLPRWAGILMAVGLALFSGSLYALSLSGARWLGAITPFGGTAFMAAWLLLAIAVMRSSIDGWESSQ